ncbi:MAG: TetR/AcrR family transcriptional regulator [Acidobacteriota bacterium]|jgi:TetR/AcrR family transcriptional regulator|nr:TetR/AcrR family transcriptional regulator [Acidobacteriota bacterium]
MTREKSSQRRMSAGDRRRQLLDAALTVFSRKGFKAATTKEIAAAAGVTEAVIFQHFPSKDELYSAVLELNLGVGERAMDIAEITRCMENGDDAGLFQTYILRILHGYRTNAAFQRVVLFAALEGHERGLNRLRQQFSPLFAQFREYVERRMEDGRLAGMDPLTVWIILCGIAHQYGLTTRIMNVGISDVPDETIAERFAQILLDGLRKRPLPAASPARQKAKKQGRGRING